MSEKVTQAQYIAHYQETIRVQQKQVFDECETLSYRSMRDLIKSIKSSKKKVCFARSGLQTEFFI
jgi:glutamine phosphoribosylpyrophosphate amidotransferase